MYRNIKIEDMDTMRINRIRRKTYKGDYNHWCSKENDHVSIEKWIQEADENLYYGKNNGRNRVIGADNDNNIDNHKD